MKNNDIQPMRTWNIGLEHGPVIISGPCSAESRSQVLKTAHALKKTGVRIFRAGIWKPRTRPNTFEGAGSRGLEWLKVVKEETGMLTATEVATVTHLEEALKAGVDLLWTGARSTANPFAIQDLANALKGVDIPVLVKNPVNPDVDLWQGAIERLLSAGITQIGAIHRGISSYEKSIYRNVPQWEIPIELKRRLPELSIICDPSHITGKRELVRAVAQKAMDLNFDGLMIESHIDPDAAWSDARQQITPDHLDQILQTLVIRNVSPEGISYEPLEGLRFLIDDFDRQLLDILKKRMEVVSEIGHYKKDNNMTVFQPGRWNEVLQRSMQMSEKSELSAQMIKKIFSAIHEASVHHQTLILSQREAEGNLFGKKHF
jgi:chorismate mutase